VGILYANIFSRQIYTKKGSIWVVVVVAAVYFVSETIIFCSKF
jgi:hypothetical protein